MKGSADAQRTPCFNNHKAHKSTASGVAMVCTLSGTSVCTYGSEQREDSKSILLLFDTHANADFPMPHVFARASLAAVLIVLVEHCMLCVSHLVAAHMHGN